MSYPGGGGCPEGEMSTGDGGGKCPGEYVQGGMSYNHYCVSRL